MFCVIAMQRRVLVAGKIIAAAGSPPSASRPERGNFDLRQAPDNSNKIDDGSPAFLLAYDIRLSSKPTVECYT